MPPRVAVYCRVSTDEQARDGYSIAAQERACRDYCAGRGWTDIRLFVDEGKSAHTDAVGKRPAFRALLVVVDGRQVDVVVVHKFDRFSRSMVATVEAFRRLAVANSGFISVTEQFDYTTAQGRLFLHMLAALAEFYSLNLSSETAKGKAERKAQGLYNGILPFGTYRPEGERLPVVDLRPLPTASTNHAGLVLAFDLAGQGRSDAEIAAALNAGGWRTTGNRGSNLWRKDSVRRVLLNRFYLGELPDGKGGWLKGQHSAVLDIEVFDRAQAARVENRTIAPTKTVPKGCTTYTLTGLLWCGQCGGKMRLARWHGKVEDARAVCYNRLQGLGCGQVSVKASVYEEQVLTWLKGVVATAEDTRAAADVLGRESGKSTIDGRHRIEAALDRLQEMYTWGDVSRADYQAKRDGLLEQLRAVTPPAPQRDLADTVKLARNLADGWGAMTTEGRNRVLAQLVERITVKQDRVVEITPRPDCTGLPALSVMASASRSGSDGGRSVGMMQGRSAPTRSTYPPGMTAHLAEEASRYGISAAARRYDVSRDTVRRALREGGGESPWAACRVDSGQGAC